MSLQLPYDKALTVEVIDGEVVVLALDGPLGISLTPGAAAETAAQLAAAAEHARTYQAPPIGAVDS